MVIVWRLRGNIRAYQNRFILQSSISSMGTVNKNSSYSPVGRCVYLFMFLGRIMFLYVFCCFTSPCNGQSNHFPSCFGVGVTNLNEAPSSFAPSPLMQVVSWLHPFKNHCEPKSNARRGGYLCRWSSTTEGDVRDCIRPRKYCVGWSVTLLTHSLTSYRHLCRH